MEEITLTANGLVHPALKLGNGKRLALLVHGFPDSPETWARIMPRLAENGYTCIAPYLRGYTRQNTPREILENSLATIQIADVAADLSALVAAAGFSQALLVGHDWGAIASYAAANHTPEKFNAIVTLSVPHLRVFLSNLWKNPRQLLQSWYILFFQLGFGIPEARIARGNFAFIESLWSTWSSAAQQAMPGVLRNQKAIDAVKKLFADKQVLHNALAYYRGLLTPPFTDLPAYNRSRELSFANISVPLLTLTGSADGCIVPEMFEGMHTACDNEFKLRVLPQAGHFLTLDEDAQVSSEILNFTNQIAGTQRVTSS